jgi:hypothetical protein
MIWRFAAWVVLRPSASDLVYQVERKGLTGDHPPDA